MKWTLALLPILVVLIVLGVVLTPEAVGMLLFGWVFFLAGVLPRMTWDRAALVQTGVAVVLLTVGVHFFARSWSAGRWKLRWTLKGGVLTVVLFAAGTAMIGASHQVVWLATSDEPLLSPALAGQRPWNLKEIGVGLHNCEGISDRLPGGTFAPDGSMLHSWQTQMLPFGWSFSTRGIDMERPWNDPVNAPYFRSVLPDFINPRLRGAPLTDEEGFGLSHYAANSHIMGANRGMALKDITDGTSTTLMVGEINAAFPPWGHPVNYRDPVRGINRSAHGFGGPRNAGGATFVMADGSVRFVSEKVSPRVLEALATPAAEDDPEEATGSR